MMDGVGVIIVGFGVLGRVVCIDEVMFVYLVRCGFWGLGVVVI